MYAGVPAEWILKVAVSDATGEIFPIRDYHQDGDLPRKGQILVFGSNTGGRHGKGSALLAAKRYGAIEGKGHGRMGNSYAIATRKQLPNRWIISRELEEIAEEVSQFVEYTRNHTELRFFVMGVGTSNAGFSVEQMAPLFRGALNCSFPHTWKPFLQAADQKIIDDYLASRRNPL